MMSDTGDILKDAWHRNAQARQRLQELAVRSVPVPKVMEYAKRLGLEVDRELAQVGDAELAYAFDLAIYAALPGRSRAIDRVARQHARLRGEAAAVLNALTASWFSVFRVLGTHPDTGWLLEDVLLGGEVWVVDLGLSENVEQGSVFATRLGRVAGYAITCGVMAVLDEAILANIRGAASHAGFDPGELASDVRFTESLWRRALGFGSV